MSDITRDYSFGGWLRNLRCDKELTLREASRRLKCDVGNLSKLERSELDPPRSAKRVQEICKAYGLNETAQDILMSTAYQHHLGKLKEEFGNTKGR
jgi:transcriptional regulator with XRE-family HTH domain